MYFYKLNLKVPSTQKNEKGMALLVTSIMKFDPEAFIMSYNCLASLRGCWPPAPIRAEISTPPHAGHWPTSRDFKRNGGQDIAAAPAWMAGCTCPDQGYSMSLPASSAWMEATDRPLGHEGGKERCDPVCWLWLPYLESSCLAGKGYQWHSPHDSLNNGESTTLHWDLFEKLMLSIYIKCWNAITLKKEKLPFTFLTQNTSLMGIFV